MDEIELVIDGVVVARGEDAPTIGHGTMSRHEPWATPDGAQCTCGAAWPCPERAHDWPDGYAVGGTLGTLAQRGVTLPRLPALRDDEVMYLTRHAQRCECGHLEAFHNDEEHGEYGCGICDCWQPNYPVH